MILNTTRRENAKTLFTPVSHKRHPILHPYGQAMLHPCETFGEELPHTTPALRKASPSLQWRHNKHDAVWNHWRPECVFNRPLRRGPKNTSKLRVTGPLCGEFTGDRGSPRTKGQWRGKCFHSMMSSLCNDTEASSKTQCCGKLCIYDTYCTIIQSFMITRDSAVCSTVFLSKYVNKIKVPTILIPCQGSHWCPADSLHMGSAMWKTHNWQDNKNACGESA